MITISIVKDSNLIKELEVKGHAESGDYGNDLVCCIVSTLTLNYVNALTDIVYADVDLTYQNGYVYLKNNETDTNKIDPIKLLSEAFLLSVKDVSETHSKFVNLKITEEIK